ncbi:Peroxisomal membrane protein 11C [Blattella germanica]|nr:Peroxisomal membrane protein 11C [Blattella germanica]
MIITDISKFLSSHNGRDKVMRTLSYSTKLAAALVSSDSLVQKLDTVSNQISACRTVLRLFDDIPMLNVTLAYGLGKEEQDIVMRILGVLTNAVDQLYFPLEHIAWASDHKLVSFRSTNWWTASTICWALSLYLNLVKTVRYLTILQNHKACLKGVDVNAVHYLPEGFLWAGKLEKWHIGLIGTVTSIISLYQSVHKIVNHKNNA